MKKFLFCEQKVNQKMWKKLRSLTEGEKNYHASTPAITTIHENSQRELATMLDFAADYGICNQQ